MDYIIQMQGINKYYMMGNETLHVLKDIDLTVERGEFIAVLGPSGSGKSTLMNMIGCMDIPDSGSYELNGIDINKINESKLADIRNKEIGFIFQKYHLIPKYNVMQNVCMPLIIRGETRKLAEEKVAEKLVLVGLEDRLKHKPSELSGGQQQRVAIARALAAEPNLLLADEPTGALDSETGKEVLGIFKKLNEMGHTIIVITHDPNVAKYAKRIVGIIDGCLVQH